MSQSSERTIGLKGAIGIGVGAIVGGGILALAGAGFAVSGPGAILAFALNGVIALLTAFSFAEVASKFPFSGGTYAFARRVLAVETAFLVGWVVWFASIVAAVLYALGFGKFASIALIELWSATQGAPPDWLGDSLIVSGLATLSVMYYIVSLSRKAAGGGAWMNVGKLIVFAALIVGGLWALRDRTAAEVTQSLTPFLADGWGGLFQAMGFTFIALQGFDLIASVAGEVRDPERTIPRAMFGSLGIALLVYIPLLFVVSVVGVEAGGDIRALAQVDAETVIAEAVRRYLGVTGYWLVLIAALLSMLSALGANLFAASRVVRAMAVEQTLPNRIARLHSMRNTPVVAILLTGGLVIVITLSLSGVAAAGAASSLIFLITFALVHGIAILVRLRSTAVPPPFRTPFFPLIQVVGGLCCVGLAVYQGITVPAAGTITIFWLGIGALLFFFLFSRRARLADVASTALDPERLQLRGKRSTVLVPIANPHTAYGLAEVALELAPPPSGRALFHSVVVAEPGWRPLDDGAPLARAQVALASAMSASMETGIFPESLCTVAPNPWTEIARVARSYKTDVLLLGLSRLEEEKDEANLEGLMNAVSSHVVVLRAPKGWQLKRAQRILVPTRGEGHHDPLLARLLSSFSRSQAREITFLQVLRKGADTTNIQTQQKRLRAFTLAQGQDHAETAVVAAEDPGAEIARRAKDFDLLILGMELDSQRRKLFGRFALQIATQSDCPLLLISYRD